MQKHRLPTTGPILGLVSLIAGIQNSFWRQKSNLTWPNPRFQRFILFENKYLRSFNVNKVLLPASKKTISTSHNSA